MELARKFLANVSISVKLFKYLRQRCNNEQISALNSTVRSRIKLFNIKASNDFLRRCIFEKVVPRYMAARISKSKLKQSPSTERIFMTAEIKRNEVALISLRQSYRTQMLEASEFLTDVDFMRFMRFSTSRAKKIKAEKVLKYDKLVSLLHRNRFGAALAPSRKNIVNLSSYILSPDEEFVLSHGLNFNIPPKCVRREDVLAEFEVLAGQLKHHAAKSIVDLRVLKRRLADIAYAYSGSPIDKSDFAMRKEFYSNLRNLRHLNDIIITKPDKGTGVVLLDKKDYILKMKSILDDQSKFRVIGPVSEFENTAKNERNMRKRLCVLHNNKLLPSSVHDMIRPTGSIRPRMYGLPKTHKPGIPLRPILSMIGSSQHKLAKWLARVLQPVLTELSEYCIKDSFSFVELLRSTNVKPDNVVMCSFDIKSLFTNVPLKEVIGICVEALYEKETTVCGLQRAVLEEFLEMATTNVEFSFDNVTYQQTDGVAMGSPLGPILANIFVGAMERRLFQATKRPAIYVRYMDDIFALFDSVDDQNQFLGMLNDLHPSLQFTTEPESENRLPFLDVMIERTPTQFKTTVYRKPTFTGHYVRWSSFCAKRRKLNLITCLVHRAINICSQDQLSTELDEIRSILATNGYPRNVVEAGIQKKLTEHQQRLSTGSDQQPASISDSDDTSTAILRLPYIGKISSTFVKNITDAVSSCYTDVRLRVVLTSNSILPTARKDEIPIHQKSNVVYKFACHCSKWYIGKTTQRLQSRIDDHVPRCIRTILTIPNTGPKLNQKLADARKNAQASSSIAEHLAKNKECLANYNDDRFSILTTGRNEYHLSVLESTYIMSYEPALCKQKKFGYKLGLFL